MAFFYEWPNEAVFEGGTSGIFTFVVNRPFLTIFVLFFYFDILY